MSLREDESLNESLASLMLPPPPLSVFSDFCKQIKETMYESDTIKEAPNFFELTSYNYVKKSPASFIALQDYGRYIQFNREILLLNNDEGDVYPDNFWNENNGEDQLMRSLMAFHKLYEEYNYLCDTFVNTKKHQFSSGDDQEIGEIYSKDSEPCLINEIKHSDAVCQTEDILSSMASTETIKTTSSSSLSIFNNIRHFFRPAFNLGNCMRTVSIPKNQRKELFFNLFDKINNENIDVFEITEKACRKTTHQILNLIDDEVQDSKTITLPIALELLLPKMQQKIDNILKQCTFLCDPLEVMSELRNYNYDQSKCVKYFTKTKHLRYLYSPQQIDIGKISDNDLKKSSNNNQETKQNLNYKNISFSSVNKLEQLESDHTSVHHYQCLGQIMTNTTIQTDAITNNLGPLLEKLHTIKKSQNYVNDDVKYLAQQLSKVFDSLKNHMIAVINQCSERLINNEQRLRLLAFSRQVEELKLKLKEEEKKRRQVYNRMQEQMGNIRVYCRCRNLSDDENVLEYLGEDSLILTTVSNERFEFDKVFSPGVTQGELYEEFRPLVMSFIDGYNVCFITYGGEASGKTYTLIGDNRDNTQQGIMQRSLVTILTEEKLRQRDWEYKISACVVEIYNDNCTDILSGESGIQIYVDNGMETAYQKLKSVPITNEADADVLIQVCTVKRKVARTALNPASSRSHLIILIRLQGCSRIHGENICSFLCLSDLAGFEDIIKAETQTNKILSKEAGYINRSLTAFNRVFVSLKKQDPNTVSYRDTKLTHLLKPFLTNSGKCALIVTVRNDKRSVGSTHNTLRFGKETRGVTLGKARRQVNLNNHPTSMI